MLLHDGGDPLAEGGHDFVLHNALDLAMHYLTYLSLHHPFNLISDDMHHLLLQSSLQLLLNDFRNFFRHSLLHLRNVRYLVDGLLNQRKAFVDRVVHAGDGL